MADCEEELKSLLMNMKEENEKLGLKLNIQKFKIMASGPITSWQMDREKMETVTDFILGSSKITEDGDYRHEIKRCLLLGKKAKTNLGRVLKSKDIALPTKVLQGSSPSRIQGYPQDDDLGERIAKQRAGLDLP